MTDKKDSPTMAEEAYQTDITRNKSLAEKELDKEVVETVHTIYSGDYFYVKITENQQDQLDTIHDSDGSVRMFLIGKMKLKKGMVLPENHEGEIFQKDLDKFAKVL